MNAKTHFDNEIKITPLRKDVLNVVLASKKPLSAYEILDKLRRKRPSAEPPTVYRVLEYLTKNQLIHRIESMNKYISCSQHHPLLEHQAILFSCIKCKDSSEWSDRALNQAIKKFIKKNALKLEVAPIEIKGVCSNCC